jgi:pimeloyl-ACP methyl ester carboxylesterase
LRWLKRIAVALVALVLLALLTGGSYELWMRRQAAREHPAPGKLVDIGGRRIQLDCRGSGSPTVVFESGLDYDGSLSWSAVHDSVARTTRACAYSRSGIMWSDARQGPHDADAIASDLHLTLQRAGERPPFVLVAHSIGGPYSMAYVRAHDDEVAGLVFVDASHPDQVQRMAAAVPVERRANLSLSGEKERSLFALMSALSWTGATRLLVMAAAGGDKDNHMPPEAMATANAYLPQSLHACLQEADAIGTSLAEGGQLRQLGDRPLIALTADAPYPPAEVQALGLSTREDAERLQAAWRELGDEEAAWSRRGRHWLVRNAHHYIQFDRPDVVIRAVQQVVAAVRHGTAPDPNGAAGLPLVSDVSH